MKFQLECTTKDVLGIENATLMLGIQIEHPRGQWKPIRIRIEFDDHLSKPPFVATISQANEVGFSFVREPVTLPRGRFEFSLGEVFVDCAGQHASIRLPRIRLLTLDGYFEELVAEKLRNLGFKAVRYGGPGKPDIIATPPHQHDRVIQVEATIEEKYDLSKWRSDIGKYHDLKDAYNLRQLLIVPLVSEVAVTSDVKDRLNHVHDPFSLICFDRLELLSTQYRGFLLGTDEVVNYLTKPGLIGPRLTNE